MGALKGVRQHSFPLKTITIYSAKSFSHCFGMAQKSCERWTGEFSDPRQSFEKWQATRGQEKPMKHFTKWLNIVRKLLPWLSKSGQIALGNSIVARLQDANRHRGRGCLAEFFFSLLCLCEVLDCLHGRVVRTHEDTDTKTQEVFLGANWREKTQLGVRKNQFQSQFCTMPMVSDHSAARTATAATAAITAIEETTVETERQSK